MPSELDRKDKETLGLGELACRVPECYPSQAYDHPKIMVARLPEVWMALSVVLCHPCYRLPIG